MPSLMAMLGLNSSGFMAGLQKAKTEASAQGHDIGKSLGESIKGALTAYAGLEGIKRAIREVGAIAEESRQKILAGAKMGITAEEFDNLDAAAKKFGSSGEAVGVTFKKIAVGSIEALDGNAEMIASFRTLGISMSDLKKKSAAELFAQIAGNLQGAQINASKLAAMVKTMGKSADELIPALKAGAFNLENPFGEEQSAHEVNAKFGKDMGVFKKLWSKTWDEVLSPDANKEGAIFRTLTWLAGKTKKKLGILDERKVTPTDVKAVTAAEVRAEQGTKKKEEKDLEELWKLEEELYKRQQQNYLESLSKEEQLVELQRRRAELAKWMCENWAKMNELSRFKASIELEKIKGEEGSLARSLEQAKPKMVHGEVSSLQKVGAYASPASLALLDINKKMAKSLHNIDGKIGTLAGPGRDFGKVQH